jgi:hypothetical protein
VGIRAQRPHGPLVVAEIHDAGVPQRVAGGYAVAPLATRLNRAEADVHRSTRRRLRRNMRRNFPDMRNEEICSGAVRRPWGSSSQVWLRKRVHTVMFLL